jgi:cell division transport system permease protein
LEQAHGIIDKLPDIESVQEVTSERMIELIRPWIGPVETLADLQLPILIDVTFKPTAKVDLESLQNQLREISAGARVEPVNKWQNHVNIVSQSVKLFAYLIMAFIFCAIAIMVVLITKSSLTAYQGIINTLSLIGAHNMYLAKQFQNQAFMIAVKGSIIGMIFAVPAVAFFAWFTHYFDIPFVLRKPPSISGMFMIILMPLTVSALCMLVTRWTVLRTLVRLNK